MRPAWKHSVSSTVVEFSPSISIMGGNRSHVIFRNLIPPSQDLEHIPHSPGTHSYLTSGLENDKKYTML